MFWRNIFIVTAVTLTGICGAIILLLTPTQVKSNPALTATPSPTPSPTPTMCPQATPEYLGVDPVTSPTDQFSQTVRVYIGRGDVVTITAESGVFTRTGAFNTTSNPAAVDVTLLADTHHHLTVYAHVRAGQQGDCPYGDYTLSTTRDRYGDPLIIEQIMKQGSHFLPFITN